MEEHNTIAFATIFPKGEEKEAGGCFFGEMCLGIEEGEEETGLSFGSNQWRVRIYSSLVRRKKNKPGGISLRRFGNSGSQSIA